VTSPDSEFLPDTPRRFARLVEVTAQNDEGWLPEELGAIWLHQLAAPVQFEFVCEKPSSESPKLEDAGDKERRTTFRELLHGTEPDLEKLRDVKEFAKNKRGEPSKGFPKEIARVLYFTSIVVALVRCKCRISNLSNQDILTGVRWALDQEWLDPLTIKILWEDSESLIRAYPVG